MRKIGKEAISPVIATIIIIAVTIAISLAVAAWMMGLWTTLVGGPKMTASLVSITVGTDGVSVTVILNNQGTAKDTLIGAVLINGTKTYSITPFTPVDINPGTSLTRTLTFSVTNAGTLVGREVSVELSFTSGTKITLTGVARSG